MSHFDALFVINQDTSFQKISAICQKNDFSAILVLSTYFLFPHEKAELASYLSKKIVFHIFTDFLTDEEMEICDIKATEDLNKVKNLPPESYNALFMKKSLENKNNLVYKKITSLHSFSAIYYSLGLGITSFPWKENKARRLSGKDPYVVSLSAKNKSLFKKLGSLIKTYKSTQNESVSLTEIAYQNNLYVFLSGIKRLKILDKVTVNHQKLTYEKNKKLFIGSFSREEVINKYLKSIKNTYDNIYIGTTIHNYEYTRLNKVKNDVLIFIDGLHPSNYPQSYLRSFFTGTFVPRDMFDKQWFKKYGKDVLKQPDFLKKNYKTPCQDYKQEIKTIILLCNHAGDWTALINRSDTDLLINNFCETASQIKDLTFIIRLHPTMANDYHEGKNSIKRIHKLIDKLNLPNLSISTEKDIQVDLDRGDFFISEYSQVLIDIYEKGKPGLSANFTQRRSFMKDYENIGFPSVSSVEELKEAIKSINSNAQEFIKSQNKAVERYNTMLKSFYAEEEHNEKQS